VLKAWLEQLRRKLQDKTRFRQAFDQLYAIVYMRAQGSTEARQAAVADRIRAFKESFRSEKNLLQYFEVHWEAKSGERLLIALECGQVLDKQ
jgi:thioredoxin-related protein